MRELAVNRPGPSLRRFTTEMENPGPSLALVANGTDALSSLGLIARRRLPAGFEVYRQGEAASEFFLLNSGWMCLYRLLPDGRRHNIKFAQAGDLVGFSLLGGMPMDHSAVCLTGTTVAVLDRDMAQRHCLKNGELMTHLSRYLSREHSLALRFLTSVTRASAIERVSHLMLELFVRARRRLPRADDTLPVPLTQEQIGDAVGLSAVHVNRMFAKLRRSHVLTLAGGLLRIECPASLFDLVALDVATMLDQVVPANTRGAATSRLA